MKKRLLSAALALAMVLTMLPLTAFAADDYTTATKFDDTIDGKSVSGTYTFTWYAAGGLVKSKTTSDNGPAKEKDVKVENAGYYYYGAVKVIENDSTTTTLENNLYHAEDGVINGTGGSSGTWYKSPIKTAATNDKAAVWNTTSFTLAGTLSSINVDKSLSINLHGQDATLALVTNSSDVTSLTITNTAEKANANDARPAGTVTLSGWTVGKSFTLSVTNAKVSGALTVDGVKDANNKYTTTANLTASTLNNAEVDGELKVSNGTMRINATNGSALKALTCENGKADIDITKSSHGKITLGKAQGNDYAKTGGTIDLIGANQGAQTAPAIETYGGTTINVKDFSTVDTITVLGGVYDADTKKTSGGKTTINVSGQSTTGAITDANDNAQPVEVSVSGSGITNGVASITLDSDYSHTVKIDGGRIGTTGSGSPAAGGLTMYGGTLTVSNSANVGAITLGNTGTKSTITANISGSETKIVSLERATTADSTINISGGTFSAASDCVKLGADYTKKTITGGTFKTSLVDKGWLKDVKFEIKSANDGYYTYTDSFQDVVDATKNNKAAGGVTAVGASGNLSSVNFYLDGTDPTNVIATIKTTKDVPIVLPTTVNGVSVATWFVHSAKKIPYDAGTALPLSDDEAETGGGWNVYTDSAVAGNGEVTEVSADGGITAKLENGVIRLTGTVDLGTGVSQLIELTVKTSADVVYNPKALYTQSQKDVIVSDLGGMERYGNQGIRVPGSTTVWTVDGSGLVEKQGNTALAEESVLQAAKADVHLSVSQGESEKKQLETALKSMTANFFTSPAIMQALNKELGKINVASALRTGRTAAAKQENRTESLTDKFLGDNYGDWKDIVVTPVLYISASNWKTAGSNHSIDLDIKPYFQLILKDPDSSNKDVAASTIQALTLDSSAQPGKVEITLSLPTGFTTSTGEMWAHHGDYVYQVSNNKFVNVNGFSKFTINGVKPLASIANSKVQNPVDTVTTYYYDDLQVAVDEVAEGGTITVYAGYPANETRSLAVTGKARAFNVTCEDGTLALTFNVDAVKTNNTYAVKLEKDNFTNAAIKVGSAGNGTASVNVSSAKPGSTVSGTYTANSGYKAGTFTATAQPGNKSVTVSVSANGTFSFTVPSDATSVTVTPSFVLDTGLPFTDVYATDWYFDGVKYCYNTTNNGYRLMTGLSDTKFGSDRPYERAQVVQILWNMKGRPEPKTTVNPYTDISSIHYAYKAVLWATENNYAEGYPDGTFRPGQSVTREEMVVFLWRAAGKPTNYNSISLNGYTDGWNVHDWGLSAVKWAVALNILSGQNSVSLNGTLAARSTAYRREVAVTVMQFDQKNLF